MPKHAFDLPLAAPAEAVLLRVGPVDGFRHALRELVVAAVDAVCPDRWLIVAGESPWVDLAWQAAGTLGVRSLVRAVNGEGTTLPRAAQLDEQALASAAIRVAAEIVGGAPPQIKRVRNEVPTYAFGATGWRPAGGAPPPEWSFRFGELEIDLRTESCFAPVIELLLRRDVDQGDAGTPFPAALPGAPSIIPPYGRRDRRPAFELDPLAGVIRRRSLRDEEVGMLARVADQRPTAVGLYGSALEGGTGDVDLLAIVPERPLRRRLVGRRVDITVLSADELTASYDAGDLFALGFINHHLPIYDPQGLLRSFSPTLPSGDALRRQAAAAARAAYELLTPEGVALDHDTWSARARWATRTLCMAHAAWHGELTTSKHALSGWFGGPDAALLMGAAVGPCGATGVRQVLARLLRRSRAGMPPTPAGIDPASLGLLSGFPLPGVPKPSPA